MSQLESMAIQTSTRRGDRPDLGQCGVLVIATLFGEVVAFAAGAASVAEEAIPAERGETVAALRVGRPAAFHVRGNAEVGVGAAVA